MLIVSKNFRKMVVKAAFLYTIFMRGVETFFFCTLRSLKIEYQHFSTSSTDGEHGSPAGIPCVMIPCIISKIVFVAEQ